MLKKICDKCGKELNGQAYFDVDAQCFGKFGQQAKSYYHYDLCEDCMVKVNNFIKGEEYANKKIERNAKGNSLPKVIHSEGYN